MRAVSAYLYRLRSLANVSLRRRVYNALGESILRYGISLYGMCSNYKKSKINKILYKIACNITYGTMYEKVEKDDKMNAARVLTIERLHCYEILVKHYFNSDFKIPLTKERILRRTEKFILPRIFTKYGKNARSYYVPFYFNKLPEELHNLDSLKILKQEMREWCCQSIGD